MKTNKGLYDLHTYYNTDPYELYEAYQNVPLDSLDENHDNNTPLHTACCFADKIAVTILLERGADVNQKNDKGYTPLYLLAKYKPCPDDSVFAEMTEMLLAKGARVPRSGKDTTALLEAVRNRHFLMADILLKSGARTDSTDSNGDNVLHLLSRSAASIVSDIKSRQRRIADFSERWYSEQSKQETYDELENLKSLEIQCCHTAKLVLENGEPDPEEKNNSGKTPFNIAAEGGARRIGALLSGQDPETDELAALAGGLDVFQALWYGDEVSLDALLRSGADTQTICEDEKMYDFRGKSPLGCALTWDNLSAAEMLLRGGADPDFRDSKEQTAFAVWMNKRGYKNEDKEQCLHILRCLTECGWNPESPADGEGNTALSVACRNVGYDTGIWAVRFLVDNGVDVNAANAQGQTPAMNLYGGRYWDGNIPRFAGLPRSYPYGGRECKEEDADILELLLEAGADINAKDKWGNTLLHYIAAGSTRGLKEAAALVMDFGSPDVNAVNNEGKTALDIATEKNNETLVKFLLKYC